MKAFVRFCFGIGSLIASLLALSVFGLCIYELCRMMFDPIARVILLVMGIIVVLFIAGIKWTQDLHKWAYSYDRNPRNRY